MVLIGNTITWATQTGTCKNTVFTLLYQLKTKTEIFAIKKLSALALTQTFQELNGDAEKLM